MKQITLLLFLVFAITSYSYSQDTFSIVALDSITGEVGSAGASCVDLLSYPSYTYHFLGELIPGVGAINTQAYYLSANQLNARNRMMEGMSPSEIITWLEENDVQSNPTIRQYGIVGFVDGEPSSAGYTGVNTDDYKNHVTGPNYSIQGNILLGQEVLDSMEYRFLNAEGDLACKLMAAMQGAKMVGADTRCFAYGTSSLFAFVKVAQPEDVFGEPSFVVGLKTEAGSGVEPIDSLQVLFSQIHDCNTVGINEEIEKELFEITPNPVQWKLNIASKINETQQLSIINTEGKVKMSFRLEKSCEIDISTWPKGIYFVISSYNNKTIAQKFVKI